MKLWPFATERKASADLSIDQLIERLEQVARTVSGVTVTPENCMRSPTVNAIVTAVSRRISVSPVSVMRRSFNAYGREQKEKLPSHPVQKLLSKPNDWQTRQEFFLDATSALVRWGRFYAYKAQGNTGPVRRLLPMASGSVAEQQDSDWNVSYLATTSGGQRELQPWELFRVRGAARDFVTGDSPVTDQREAIALEIALEQFGAAFFGNGGVPLLFFTPGANFKDFKDDEQRDKFLASLREKLSGKRAFSGFWLPKGIETKDVQLENEKAQFVEARKFQRTVIAGAFGVPPHLVGDLERATFNNVEQQDTDFVSNVVLPYAQAFEAAMERDLLTQEDRNSGVIIRFNLDAIQRADFKSRQEGLQIQRRNGAINANEWREMENRNPISEDEGGELYIVESNMQQSGATLAPPTKPIPPATPDGSMKP